MQVCGHRNTSSGLAELRESNSLERTILTLGTVMKPPQTTLAPLAVWLCLFVAGCVNPTRQDTRGPLWSNSKMPVTGIDTSLTESNAVVTTPSQVRLVNYETQLTTPAIAQRPNLLNSRGQNSSNFDDSSGGLALEELEQMALANNPTIGQASAAICKTMGIRTQVGLRPNSSIGYFGEEIGNGSAGLHGMFLSKTIVRGSKLALNRQVISHDVDVARLQLETQRLRVRNDVRIQFYETLAAQRRLELARQFREVAAQGLQVSEDLVNAKEAARPDVLQSEIQLGEVDLAIQQAQFELQGSWNELMAITGTPSRTITHLIGDLATPVIERDAEILFGEIAAASPLLHAAYARVDRARANIGRQHAQAIPNVNAQLGVGHDNGTGDEFANVQFSLPIPWHNQNQGNIQAAKADYQEAMHNAQRIEMQIRQGIARVLREYQVAQATVAQYESSIIPKSKESLELLVKAQEAGEFDFLRVLTARRTYFDVQNRYVSALGLLAQANVKMDGLLLSGGLSNVGAYDVDDGLRGQALSGQ